MIGNIWIRDLFFSNVVGWTATASVSCIGACWFNSYFEHFSIFYEKCSNLVYQALMEEWRPIRNRSNLVYRALWRMTTVDFKYFKNIPYDWQCMNVRLKLSICKWLNGYRLVLMSTSPFKSGSNLQLPFYNFSYKVFNLMYQALMEKWRPILKFECFYS